MKEIDETVETALAKHEWSAYDDPEGRAACAGFRLGYKAAFEQQAAKVAEAVAKREAEIADELDKAMQYGHARYDVIVRIIEKLRKVAESR